MKTRTSTTLCGLPFAVAVLSFSSPIASLGATISWQAPGSISSAGDGIIDTSGFLVEAINFGHSVDRTVNGVVFVGQTVGVISANSNFSAFDDNVNLVSVHTDGGISGSFEAMMDAFSYTLGSTGPQTVTLSGLTPTSDYLIQFLISDDRSSGTKSFTQVYNTGASTTGAIAHDPSYSLIGTFTADSATQQFTVTPSALRPIINGYQLRSVPEPSGMLLSLVAVATIVLRRRRS